MTAKLRRAIEEYEAACKANDTAELLVEQAKDKFVATHQKREAAAIKLKSLLPEGRGVVYLGISYRRTFGSLNVQELGPCIDEVASK